MNNILSLQQNLADLGFSGGIFDIFTDMAQQYETAGLGFLTKQVEADFAALGQFLNDDGLFEADELGLSQAAVENAMSTLTQLVDAVTAAYNRQKKAIEERYRAEIDAIKNSHSERWAMIDYTDKLAEAEDRILQSRRKLMGLAISGVSSSTLEQAEKDLKKLQQERQRIIEEQMISKAEKELEARMNEELIEAQRELGEILEGLGESLSEYQDILQDIFREYIGPGETPITGGGGADSPNIIDRTVLMDVNATMLTNTETIVDLIASNSGLTSAIIDLTNTLTDTPTIGGGSGGGSGGGGSVTFAVLQSNVFDGIPRI
jgi:hypothetical protein